MNNKVIIIGNDHINTLGLIRTFGENGINPYVFLINNSKNSFVLKSKYIKKYWISDNENISILKMMDEFKNEKMKPIVIPSSDVAAYFLDFMYDKLCDKFIIPNISECKGKVIEYMDKYKQYELCKKFDINMAKSISLNLNDFNLEAIDLTFPCIIKPLVSAGGNKDDIVICDDYTSFLSSLDVLKSKKYENVIIQDFIDYDYECDIVGFSYNNKCSIPGILKKHRIWPLKRGSTTFGKAEPNFSNQNMIDKLILLMSSLEYNGIFDIEVFVKGNDFYLNEINFRNSAISYAYSTSYVPFYWYLSNIKNSFYQCPLIEDEYLFLNDIADLHNVLDKNISLKSYIKDKKSSFCLAFNNRDNNPYYYMIFKIFFEKLKINKFLDYTSKILHKDIDEYIMCLDVNNFNLNFVNHDYDVIEFDLSNYKMICENDKDVKEFGYLLKSKTANGIALIKNGSVICRGFIKYKNARDRFLKIKNKNSFLISSIHVFPEFRGKHYQCDLVKELISRYVSNLSNNISIYAVVYKYNIPSLKNLKTIGFKIVKEKSILRFLGKSINKERV